MKNPAVVFDTARRQLKDLAPLADELNAASDRVTEELRSVQAQLVALNLGVDVTLDCSLDGAELPDDAGPNDCAENHYLSFGRHGRGWALLARLVRKSVFDDDYLHEIPLLEAPRDLRIAAKDQIEDLLKLIAAKAKEKVSSLNSAIDTSSQLDANVSDVRSDAEKYGARVYGHADGVVLVKQTIKRGDENGRFVVDGHRERFVDPGDNAALGAAVRAAIEGRL